MARTLADIVDEAKVLALAEVLQPTDGGFLREVCRIYSEKWHTPLHVVEQDVPIERVLQAFFEDRYKSLEDQERDELLQELLLTPEDRAAAQKALDEDDEEFMREANEEAERLDGTMAGAALDGAKSAKAPPEDLDPPPAVSVSFVDEIPDDDDWGLLDDPKKQS